MGNQSSDPNRGQPKTARVGQPGEEHRTSQENAGSTEGGGTRNAGGGRRREPQRSGGGQVAKDDGQVAKEDGITRDDIEAGNDLPNQRQ